MIELMVTIAVLAIIMVLAAPSFSDFFQRYRLRGAADDVATLLVTARTEAMTRNRDVAVVFNGTNAAWCVGAVSATDPGTPGQAVTAVPTCDCDSGACRIGGRITEVDAGDYAGVTRATAPASFVFDRLTGAVRSPTGVVIAPGATSFKSQNLTYTLEVAVSPLGRGQLCVPTGSPSMAGFPTCGAN